MIREFEIVDIKNSSKNTHSVVYWYRNNFCVIYRNKPWPNLYATAM